MNLRVRLKKTEWVLFLTVFFAYAYFFQGRGGWGTSVRFDYVYSSVEKKSLNIDAFHENTEDKAFYKDHYYLN